MSTPAYPVHVTARLDPDLSRWLWLVKWLLAIPHFFVLAFLWLAFGLLSLVAFFAILFTARYPRAIFEFNVGVLRWSWRVSYYTYGALGTDRYPPFTLEDRVDYPARLEIDYPVRLSRGLVLVKWWLLAIPHYLVLALFFGGAGYAAEGGDESGAVTVLGGSSGLVGLLVLVAAVVLLFTAHYPRPVFDFVLGMDRWGLRVAAYAALMTDQYPPFRLDQGGDDPGTAEVAARESAPPQATRATPATRHWSAGRVIGLVLASLLVMPSLGAVAAGAGLLVADQVVRDDAGFVMSDEETLATPTYALASKSVEIHSDAADDFVPERLLGDVRVSARSPDGDLFMGLARTEDVERYLGDVQHATVVGLQDDPEYRISGTGAPTGPPEQEGFWVAQTTGGGEQTLTWKIREGDWTLVVMNADASAGVNIDATTGAEFPAIGWLATLLLVAGGIGLVVAGVALALLLRTRTPAG